MIKQYYIFDIKQGEDDVHGNIIIVRAGIVHDNLVSESPSTWDIFLFKDTPSITNGIVSLARSSGGHWTVNFSEFRESHIDFEGKTKTVYYHKSLPLKRSFSGIEYSVNQNNKMSIKIDNSIFQRL